MQLERVRRTEIINVAVLRGESDRVDNQRVAVLVMAIDSPNHDGFTLFECLSVR